MEYVVLHNQTILGKASELDCDRLDFEEDCLMCIPELLNTDQILEYLYAAEKHNKTDDVLAKELCKRHHLDSKTHKTYEQLFDAIAPF